MDNPDPYVACQQRAPCNDVNCGTIARGVWGGVGVRGQYLPVVRANLSEILLRITRNCAALILV